MTHIQLVTCSKLDSGDLTEGQLTLGQNTKRQLTTGSITYYLVRVVTFTDKALVRCEKVGQASSLLQWK